MSIVLVGSTSGSITLQEPAVAGTTVLDLPATSGTILTTASQSIPSAALPVGSVLQVVQGTTSTQVSSSSSTYADTGATATITPKFSTSKILVLLTMNGIGKETSNTSVDLKLQKNSSDLSIFTVNTVGYTGNTSITFPGCSAYNYLDSPATTSATTYKVQFASHGNNAVVYIQLNSSISTITLMEIAA